MAIELLAAIERDQPRVLAERGRGEEQVAHPRARLIHQIGRHHQPAEPPARHAEILGKAVYHDGLMVERQHRARRFAIGDALVDLVRHDADAPGPAHPGDGCHFIGRDHRSGRVGGAGDDHAVGRRIERFERGSGDLVSHLGAARQFDRLDEQCPQRVAIGDIAGPCDGDARAGAETQRQRDDERGRGTAGQHDLRGRDQGPGGFFDMPRQPGEQLRAFPVAVIRLVQHLPRAGQRGSRCAGRGLAILHANDRAALGHEALSVGGNGNGVKRVELCDHAARPSTGQETAQRGRS